MLPDALLDDFVARLARRIASFDQEAITDTNGWWTSRVSRQIRKIRLLERDSSLYWTGIWR